MNTHTIILIFMGVAGYFPNPAISSQSKPPQDAVIGGVVTPLVSGKVPGPPPKHKERKPPEGLVMMVQGWCPSGDCSFSRIVEDMAFSHPNPTKLAYKGTTFVTKAEAARLSYYGKFYNNKLADGTVEKQPWKSGATFTFLVPNSTGNKKTQHRPIGIDKNGDYFYYGGAYVKPDEKIRIRTDNWINLNDDGYFVPLPIIENLVGYSLTWEPGRRFATEPHIVNPARVEEFPDDGVAVSFEAHQEKDALFWKISEATHGLSAMVSEDGGKTWVSIYEPNNHKWEKVAKDDHSATGSYRWKEGEKGYPDQVSEDSGKTWHEGKSRTWDVKKGDYLWPDKGPEISTDGRKTWHRPFDAMAECPGKEHAFELRQSSTNGGVPLRFLFQGTRGMRVFWKIFEIGKGWTDE